METVILPAKFGKAFLQDIAIDRLHSGTYQPRESFSAESLASLSQTIGTLGVLEPLIVRASIKAPDQFEIIAGERRWRAAKQAGLATVPCLVAAYTNEQAAQVALIENTCREALNPIAEASALQRLGDEFGYTHEEIGRLLGLSRPQVTHQLRLLTLDGRIQHWLKQGALSEAHGKVLAGVKGEKQYWYAYEAIKKGWSVRVLTEAITAGEQKMPQSSSKGETVKALKLENEITDWLGCRVKLKVNKNGSGSFRIDFPDEEGKAQILEKWGFKKLLG